MRITILVGAFPPKCLAGTEIATYNLAEHLAQRGHEIHIITSHDDGLPEHSKENGFWVHRVARSKIRIIGILPFWVRMCLQIWKIKPDVVQSQSLVYGIPAMSAKRILKIPYIVWGQGSDIYLPGRLLSTISRPILQNADAVLALTEDMKREIQRICVREVSIIPNGIDLEKFKRAQESHKEGSIRRIIFVGRLLPVKGVQYLIEALAIVHQKIPDIKLVVVGTGAERSKLEEQVEKLGLKNCVHFLGQIPQERIPDVMHQADIFVLPSLSEGFPVVLLEAMASGLPIIATSVRGIPDIIDEGVNGYLINVRRPDEIAARILTLMLNDVIREKISIKNREKATMFTWDKIADRMEGIYRRTIALRS